MSWIIGGLTKVLSKSFLRTLREKPHQNKLTKVKSKSFSQASTFSFTSIFFLSQPSNKSDGKHFILFSFYPNILFSESKRLAKNPSQVKTFSIDLIMEHDQKTSIKPINTSSSKFGGMYENQFAVLDDAKHVIGVDPSDARNFILENIKNGTADKIQWIQSSYFFITTFVYDEDTGYLYTGDCDGRLLQYKLDKTTKSCKKVKNYGKLKIGEISSSHRFLDFVFFGGTKKKIRVLDLSTNKLLPGHLQTSIGVICSLNVCVKSEDKIYLTVSGIYSNYSDNKTDLFDLTDLLQVDPVILQKYLK